MIGTRSPGGPVSDQSGVEHDGVPADAVAPSSTAPTRSSRDATMAELIRARRARAQAIDRIAPRDGAAAQRLSYQQERLFALDQIVDNLLAYNQAQAFRVRGPLDLDALDTAVRELQLRHDILRTRIRLADGEVVVDIGEPRSLERVAAAGVRDEPSIRDLVTDEVRRPLNLSDDGPLRITVFTLTDDDHVLVLSLHHIACDDVSKRVIFTDLGELYGALAAGRAPTVARPELQFGDYATWQRNRLDSADAATTLSWWVDYLAGAPASTTLPLDRPRPAVATNHGAKLRSQLPADAMGALTAASRTAGATPFMALLSGFAWLLEQYGADGEAVIGMPVSGRGRDELRAMVGLFLNTLPVRIATGGDPTYAELIEHVRDSTLDVLGHQDVPFELILEAVRPERDPSRTPISQVMCTMRSESGTEPTFAGSQIEAIGYDGGWTKFDLGLTGLLRADGTLDLLWQYNTDLFDHDTIENLAAHLSSLLTAAAAGPHRPMSEIAVPPPAQLEQVVSGWNDTAVTDVPDEAYHHLMQAQVDRTPDAAAVLDDGGPLTFRQLDERANQVAHELLARGVARGDIVAIAMQRSTDCEAAILGVLKAGAAYLPLDASYPPARLEFMLRDSDARVILVDRASAQSIPLGTPRIVLAGPDDPTHTRPTHRPDVACGPSDLAYVIYTSGSTGQPKGVLCEHGGLVNRLVWMARRYGVGSGDVLLQKTPMSFDVSLSELLLPPICGATLVMAQPGRHGDPQYLRSVIDAHGVTFAHFVPSMLAAFLLATPANSCPSLRMITASGEALSLETARRCRELLPHAALYNLYGPTEASIEVTATECLERDTPRMTIGRPIANLRTYVLDEQLRPVAVGAVGELYLAGAGIARGYLNRDELTAERFLTDPFAGGRMYRTGDRARWLADGRIDYLGRLDHQIKLRGFRIELGEIESALRSLDDVADAICDVRGPTPDDLRLVGYIVPAGAGAPEPHAVRRQLAALLPDYEVPSTIVLIDAVPVSSNGKADRRLLADPVIGTVADEVVAPRDDLERAIAEIWATVVGHGSVLSVHDNFFDVGGHSLSAVRLFAKLEKAFHVAVPLSLMIAGTTIADTATYIRTARAGGIPTAGPDGVSDLIVPMRTQGGLHPLFAMPGLRGDVLVYRQMLAELDPQRPVYGVQCRGTDGAATPRTTIQQIAGDCIQAMRSVQPSGPYHVFGYCFSGIVAYEVAHQLTAAGEDVAFLGVIDATPPRGTLSPTVERSWRRRLRRLTGGGGLRQKLAVVAAFARRKLRRSIAEFYVRLGRRVPPQYIDFYAANRKAQMTYIPPAAEVRMSLIRKAVESETTLLPSNRWAELARRGLDIVAIDAVGADHHQMVQARFAGQVARAVNDAIAARTAVTPDRAQVAHV